MPNRYDELDTKQKEFADEYIYYLLNNQVNFSATKALKRWKMLMKMIIEYEELTEGNATQFADSMIIIKDLMDEGMYDSGGYYNRSETPPTYDD